MSYSAAWRLTPCRPACPAPRRGFGARNSCNVTLVEFASAVAGHRRLGAGRPGGDLARRGGGRFARGRGTRGRSARHGAASRAARGAVSHAFPAASILRCSRRPTATTTTYRHHDRYRTRGARRLDRSSTSLSAPCSGTCRSPAPCSAPPARAVEALDAAVLLTVGRKFDAADSRTGSPTTCMWSRGSSSPTCWPSPTRSSATAGRAPCTARLPRACHSWRCPCSPISSRTPTGLPRGDRTRRRTATGRHQRRPHTDRRTSRAGSRVIEEVLADPSFRTRRRGRSQPRPPR